MRKHRERNKSEASEEMRCSAVIPEFKLKGCGAILNGRNVSDIISGRRKLKICSLCERKLKLDNLQKMRKIEQLLYGKKSQSNLRE